MLKSLQSISLVPGTVKYTFIILFVLTHIEAWSVGSPTHGTALPKENTAKVFKIIEIKPIRDPGVSHKEPATVYAVFKAGIWKYGANIEAAIKTGEIEH